MSLWFRFVLAVLATWRITHLLAREDGPFDVIFRFRNWLGEGSAARLIDCFQCLSIWIAAPVTLFITRKPIDFLLAWFALSGAACLLEQIAQEAVVMQPVPEPIEREVNNGMLRTETGRIAEEHTAEAEMGESPTRKKTSTAD